MKQSWLVRNLVMNFVIIFALLFTEQLDLDLTPSMIIAYYISEIACGFLFKIPIFNQSYSAPTMENMDLKHAIFLIIPALLIGFTVSQIIQAVIGMKIHEGQAIVFVVLLINLVLTTLDHQITKQT